MTIAPLVRPMIGADAAVWHSLMREGAVSMPMAFLMSLDELRAMTPEAVLAIVARGHLHGVFASEGGLIGVAGLNTDGMERLGHRASIGPFYITGRARGTGAADALMAALVEQVPQKAVDWLDLWVAADNARARAFYARSGFADVCVRPDAVRIDGVACADVLMARHLGAAKA